MVTIARTIQIELETVEQPDQNYISVTLLTVLEPFLGVISCTLPVLRPVARRITAAFRKGEEPASDNDDDNIGIQFVRSLGRRGKTARFSRPHDLEATTVDSSSDDFHKKHSESGEMPFHLVLPPIVYGSNTDSWRISLPPQYQN